MPQFVGGIQTPSSPMPQFIGGMQSPSSPVPQFVGAASPRLDSSSVYRQSSLGASPRLESASAENHVQRQVSIAGNSVQRQASAPVFTIQTAEMLNTQSAHANSAEPGTS